MVSLDLSAINILLMAAVAVLFILFVTVLMKLNPSTEKRENAIEVETKVDKQKPLQTSSIAPQNPSLQKVGVPRVSEKPLATISQTSEGSSAQAKQETPAPTSSESREIPKPQKTLALEKTESAVSKRDCMHHFGYLRTLPKNAPIPDECFGCPKIVECLVNAKTQEG